MGCSSTLTPTLSQRRERELSGRVHVRLMGNLLPLREGGGKVGVRAQEWQGVKHSEFPTVSC